MQTSIRHNKPIALMVCWLSLMVAGFSACQPSVMNYTLTDRLPAISPDYTAITLPPNIAPLNFQIDEQGEDFVAKIWSANNDTLTVHCAGGKIQIDENRWKNIISNNKGMKLCIAVFALHNGRWTRFKTIENQIANEPIDSYMAYRLVEPLFETWDQMGIYQRCLENFDEKAVMANTMSDGNCMNCHAFNKNSSRTMMFHMRGRWAGTYIYREGKLEKVNTKTDQTISPGVYPSWHPNGRDIAFSVNHIAQTFHAMAEKKVEVLDTISDIILYDAVRNEVFSNKAFSTKNRLETFPSWSPDGKWLYYCSALKPQPFRYDQVKYDLLRVNYNEETRTFGVPDTIVSSQKNGKSVSFPRISPDGKYVLFALSDYGNFSIWHRESDLYLLDIENNIIGKPDINSNETESYHTWSSSGRWIVFSSRRTDGLFTRPYFCYFDSDGKAHKPFLLPQKDPAYYNTFLKSYNIPELVTSEIELTPGDIANIMKNQAKDAKYMSN